MDYKANIEKIRSDIREVCRECGRSPDEITLIAAVKTQTSGAIAAVAGCVSDLGENRVQEFVAHYAKDAPFKWHFIGRLQTNKVKYLIGKDVLIHSLDREELAKEIDRLSLKNSVITDCLVEVNIADEASKGGTSADGAEEFINGLAMRRGIRVLGLMSVLPASDNAADTERYYRALYELFVRVRNMRGGNLDCKYLSAGMSNDYKTAVKYGANMIRLGSAIFGKREV
ncbi:MAG: YggS family pyridoxal phosphate-dependent enzyme [Clostridiales bacterium]|jgi:pyridoxal phosphate enzyme (YggS family)|nr:YggS family pyridoxal phosphate-dependent enzyme [Clostridiales bacterium]